MTIAYRLLMELTMSVNKNDINKELVMKTKKYKNTRKGEGGIVKKILLSIGLVFISIVLIYGYADAIDGKCGDCHTMHSSQDGTATTPNENLTKNTCVGCHNGGVAAAPNVFGELAAARTAGGTFNANIVDGVGEYKKAHNVRDITWTNDEVELLNTTPGGAETAHGATPTGASELYCSGTAGCHGNHDGTGFKGYHHGSNPNAYRFLKYYNGTTHTDIKGKGSTDWELGGADATNHNVYYAMSDDNATTYDSISALCSMCHGEFHGQDDTTDGGATPWKRHPTEILVPAGWDPGVTVDYDTTPFAFTGADYTGVAIDAAYSMSDSPRVACISCHVAHGSDYNDLLRFDYTTDANAGVGLGGTTGCLACHTEQRS